MSNLEMLLTAWLTDGTIPDDFTPETRIEEYLVAILDGVDDDVTPESRADVLLDAIAAKYAGYADGITDLEDELGVSAVPPTPQQLAALQTQVNEWHLQSLADKGITPEEDNTFQILAAYEQNWPSGGGGFEASVEYDDKTDKLFLTNNFYTICRTVMFGSTSANNSTGGQDTGGGLQGNSPVLGKLVDTSGANVPYINGSNGYQPYLTRYFFNGSTNGSSSTAIVTGTGTTAPAKTDYSLTSINYADTTLVMKKETLDDYSGTMVVVATIGNTSGADRVINEIGITSIAADSGSWQFKKVLIARAVLSSPVTLANGESKVFTVCIGLPTPE